MLKSFRIAAAIVVIGCAAPLLAEEISKVPGEPVAEPSDSPSPAADKVGGAAVDTATAPVSEPRKIVAALNDSLLAVLKEANDLDYAQRFEKLAPALEGTFDLKYMARQAVGRAFLQLGEADRETWYRLFKDYMTANYASRFDHYSEQRFEILGEEPGAKDTVLVRTLVIDPQDENVNLSYRLRETPAGWKVVDVYLKGTISELALRRSEYASVLKREGFPALAASITAKIESMQ